MMDDSKIEALNSVVSKLIGREAKPLTLLGQYSPIIDVSRANLHESKKEFLVELASVEAVIANLQSIIDQIVPNEEKDTPDRKAMLDRLQLAIETKPPLVTRDRRRCRWSFPAKSIVACGQATSGNNR